MKKYTVDNDLIGDDVAFPCTTKYAENHCNKCGGYILLGDTMMLKVKSGTMEVF